MSVNIYSSGSLVSSGEFIENATIADGGNNSMDIYSGGVANSTTVNSGGYMYVSSGGVANNTTVNGDDPYYRGYIHISSGGTANSTTVNSGGCMNIRGGVANSTTVNGGGGMYIYSGGTAILIKENGGYVYVGYGANVTFVSNTINGITITGLMTVHKNTIANSTTVNSSGYMCVSSGGTANSTLVNSSGYMYISSGGVANNTTVHNDGGMDISSGGVVNSTTVYGGDLGISSGGVANNTTVHNDGWMDIYSGGVANSTTVNSMSVMVISSGGTANDFTLKVGGNLGGFSFNEEKYWSSYVGGVTEISDNVMIVDSHMLITSGGTANSTTVKYWGDMYISSGGVANNTTVHNDGWMRISSGGVANSTTVNSSGYMHIYSGGVANSTTVNSGGWMYISSGGVANITTFIYGYMYIFSGGVANSTTVNSSGYMYISSGGKHAGSLQIADGASVSVEQGGIINFTVVDRTASDGYLINNLSLIKGTPTYTITVSASQESGIYKLAQGAGNFSSSISIGDGTINYDSITVNGEDFIYNGITYSLDSIDGNLTLTVSANAAPPPAAEPSVFIYSNGILTSSGTVINDATIVSGGNDSMHISSGGVASDTTVKGWGWLHVESAGSAVKTFLNSDGCMAVSRSGYASDTVVSSGAILYLNECSVDKVTVSSGGSMRIESSVTARELNIISGAEYEIYIDSNTDIQGQYNNSAFVMNNSLLEDFTIHSGGIIKLKDGVIGSNTVVNESGYLHVSSGAVHKGTLTLASEVIVADGGIIDFTVSERSVSDDYLLNDMSLITEKPTYTITVSDNQAVGTYKLAQKYYYDDDNFSIGSGSFYFYETITVNGEDVVWKDRIYSLDQIDGNLTLTVSENAAPPPAAEPSVFIYSNGILTSSGTVINDATIVSGGNNRMYISSGGIANNTVVNSKGEMFISNGGTANDTVINSAGALQILSGGYASRLIINSGVADAYVMDGGRVDDVTVSSGGRLYVSSGQAVNITDVKIKNGGKIDADVGNWGINISGTHEVYGDFCVKDNYASNFTAYGDDWFYINSGGVADSINAVALGRVIVRAGALASNTDIYNEGYLRVDSDGRAENTNIENGLLRINSGGIAKNTYMSSGELQISSGAVHQGELQIANGAIVSASQGGMIDFTVADRSVSDDYLINDLSLISGNPTYTITVSANQESGFYKLAQGAGNFSGSITIGDGTINYGSITVNGEDFVYNDITYSLDQVDGNLTLTVEKFNEDTTPPEKPQPSANITTPTERNVTVTAVFSNDSVVREYSLDGENWLEYEKGVVFEQNGTVYFRGTDAAGNISEIAVYNVENIELRDLTLSVYGNPAKWTNNDVSLTAISNRQAQIQYSFDGQKWLDGKYVVLTENKTVYFRAVDNFGNTAEKTVYVTKIDKVAPDTPLVSADVTENTNSAVTVTAVFSSDSVVKEYSLDGENWLEYERGVVFDENGTIYFRGTDAAGNISETAVYNVDNIDKEGSIISVSGNPTEWTNKDVVLTAFASDGVIEYFDGQKWVANNSLTVTENGTYRFRVTDEAGNVTETSVVVDKIDKIAPTLEISGNPVDWTEPGVILQAEASDGIIEYFDGQKWLASSNMTVYENGTYLFRVTDAAGNVTEKSVTVDKIDAIAAPQNLSGSADGVSWESDAAKFNFKLTNGSGNILTLMTNGNQLDFYGLLYGEYSAKFKSFNGTLWSETIDISSTNSHITPQYFKSDADGADDVFFADSYSNWTRGYGVSHIGSRDRWNGTGEVVELKGKLRIKNIYEGSSDYGTLVLTDYLCGDAVSADDIFSASPLEIQSVRLSQINEIFAGAGDDIIDMTSQRFEVSGSLKIHGGSGDDVIWANNGENKLFGDAGNDRIVGGIDNDIIVGGAGNDSLHGGGGNDIFVFGSDFGNDTVEQLAGGKVTLIFESEKVKWDGAAYTDGKNSVTLSGDFEVEVRYGATPELAAIGAFDNFTTEKIFEDKALIA